MGNGEPAKELLLMGSTEHEEPTRGAKALAQGCCYDRAFAERVTKLRSGIAFAIVSEDRDAVGVVDVEK
ncbi:hypothetical protein D3C71_1920420 [compost metagenome]